MDLGGVKTGEGNLKLGERGDSEKEKKKLGCGLDHEVQKGGGDKGREGEVLTK